MFEKMEIIFLESIFYDMLFSDAAYYLENQIFRNWRNLLTLTASQFKLHHLNGLLSNNVCLNFKVLSYNLIFKSKFT